MAFPLHDAARNGNLQGVHELLAKQADPNQQDKLRRTPLHLAAWAGHTVSAHTRAAASIFAALRGSATARAGGQC